MNRIAIAFVGGLTLAGCAGSAGTVVTDATDCATTLAAAGGSGASIAATAAITPSCQRLALDALNEIIKLAGAKSATARAAMGHR